MLAGVSDHDNIQSQPDNPNYEQSMEESFLQPVHSPGVLTALKTKLEIDNPEDTVEALVIRVDPKAASLALKAVQEILVSRSTIDLQHLRRFVKYDFLPARLKRSIQEKENSERVLADPSLSETILKDLSTGTNLPSSSLYMLISSTDAISLGELSDCFTGLPIELDREGNPQVFTFTVPALTPISEQQAQQMTEKYWPTIFRNSNPFGPHPSILSRAEVDLSRHVGKWMNLAEQAAEQTKSAFHGEHVGAVIVSPGSGTQEAIAIVAGDARHSGPQPMVYERQNVGNVAAHATMRAIAMVARKRRHVNTHLDDIREEYDQAKTDREHSPLDIPLTTLEKTYYEKTQMAPNGYLCNDLDIYVTHEPCTMCSMAILHSRFARVIFGQRMPLTGGLTAETSRGELQTEPGNADIGGLGYGMFWRKELNWKLLAWQWQASQPDSLSAIPRNMHA
ncbi:MAG: ubiquitin-like protein atg8 [Chaenotheca gracillima]|nr:MAG: ubiquitin-like protein atg8 [Chaenotheca gracillima]